MVGVDMDSPKEILAAFQGGGAKGIAYVGAIQALEARDYQFKAVAGTSAGSIVAALIAAGFRSAELIGLVPRLLSAITTVKPPAFATPDDPRQLGHYSLEGVRELLETALREKVRGEDEASGNDVTFRELYDATGIELNILVTVAPGEPTVLSVWSSPECQVSFGVVASSAIPFIMNPQLLTSEADGVPPVEAVTPPPEDPWLGFLLSFVPLAQSARNQERTAAVRARRHEVTQVTVDGGAWANYPGLCFTDASLRYYHGAPDLSAFPMVGLVLDTTPDASDPAPSPGKARRAARRQAALRTLVELVAHFRWFSFFLPGFAIFFGSLYLIYLQWTELPAEPDAFAIGWRLATTPVLLWMGAVGAGWAYLSNYVPAARLSLSTLIGGLTSVSVKVPPWVGAHPHSRLIRVPASKGIISTVSFTPTSTVVETLVSRAAAHVGADLDRLPLGSAHAGRRLTRANAVRFVDMKAFDAHPPPESGIGSALGRLGMR